MTGARDPRIGRFAPAILAAGFAAVFLLVHVLVFEPLATRYRTALHHAADLGLMLDPAHPSAPPPLSPRVFALLSDNSLPSAEVDAKVQSGAISAEIVQSVSALASRHDLEIVVAEPGTLSQLPGAVEGRAHLKLRGSFSDFVQLMGDLASGDRLWGVERFSVSASKGPVRDIEIWVVGCRLRRAAGAS